MSVVAFIKRLREKGWSWDQAIEAAEAFEAEAPKGGDGRPTTDEAVWVYVMGVDHPGDALVKVGISQDPESRRATLERQCEMSLYVAVARGPFARTVARAIEKASHAALASRRHSGEWFTCDTKLAADTVNRCAEACLCS